MTKVKVSVTEIKDGWEYEGNVDFDGTKFEYRLKFDMHLKDFDRLAVERGPQEAIEHMHFDVTDAKGNPVGLDYNMKLVFISTVGDLATQLYLSGNREDYRRNYLVGDRSPIMRANEISLQHGLEHSFNLPEIPILRKFLDVYRGE